jgi:hypothetical protein
MDTEEDDVIEDSDDDVDAMFGDADEAEEDDVEDMFGDAEETEAEAAPEETTEEAFVPVEEYPDSGDEGDDDDEDIDIDSLFG